jgi:hypothetical protein
MVGMYKMRTVILGHSTPVVPHAYSPPKSIALPVVLSSSFRYQMVTNLCLQELLNHGW